MRHFLIHPTHRKFIRLLRERIKVSNPIIFTQSDLDAYRTLWQKEKMSMIDRHQGIYRLVLTAVYRPIDQIDKSEIVGLIGRDQINSIEKAFAEAERKHLRITVLSGYVFPVLMRIATKGPRWIKVVLVRFVRIIIGRKTFNSVVSGTTINNE